LRGPDHHSLGRELGGRCLCRFGDPEIGDDHAARRVYEDVVRLDVAVDDAAPVRVRERVGDLARDARRVSDRQAPLLVQQLA